MQSKQAKCNCRSSSNVGAGLDSSTILDVLISSTVYDKYCQHFLAMLKYINSFQHKIGIILSMLSYTNGLCKVSKTDVKSCLVSTTLWEDLRIYKLQCKNSSTVIKVMLRIINIHDKIHTWSWKISITILNHVKIQQRFWDLDEAEPQYIHRSKPWAWILLGSRDSLT